MKKAIIITLALVALAWFCVFCQTPTKWEVMESHEVTIVGKYITGGGGRNSIQQKMLEAEIDGQSVLFVCTDEVFLSVQEGETCKLDLIRFECRFASPYQKWYVNGVPSTGNPNEHPIG